MGAKDSKPLDESKSDSLGSYKQKKDERPKLGEPVRNLRRHLELGLPEIEFAQMPDNIGGDAAEALKDGNRMKNRYVSVIPYDKTRVFLKKDQGVSDYINANFIDGPTEKYYIATQGPLIETSKDFWRMMWEVDAGVVVMLTKTIENGRIKCTRYWPEENEEEPPDTGDFKVFMVSEEDDEKFGITTRKFELTNLKEGDRKREIIQYQYHAWPDQGVPEDTRGVRQLVKLVDRARRRTLHKGPIVTHCSAGIGRTGAFITIHHTLHRVRKHVRNNPEKPFDFNIYETVRSLRTQRTGMVQQPEQYRFCYEAIIKGAEKLGMTFDGDSNFVKKDSDPSRRRISESSERPHLLDSETRTRSQSFQEDALDPKKKHQLQKVKTQASLSKEK